MLAEKGTGNLIKTREKDEEQDGKEKIDSWFLDLISNQHLQLDLPVETNRWILTQSMGQFLSFAWRLPRQIPHYEPWYCYRQHKPLQKSYQLFQEMPVYMWPQLVIFGEILQTSEERDAIYQMLQQDDRVFQEAGVHERSWYTCKRI